MKKITLVFLIALFLLEASFAQTDSALRISWQTDTLKNDTSPISTLAYAKQDSIKPTPYSPSAAAQSTSPYPFPYFIPGDAIQISVYPDTAIFINGLYHIDQKGYINLPMVGLVPVKDKTRGQFIDYLKTEYSDYLKYPNINVTNLLRVSFFGGFYRPGLYWVEPRNTLWDAFQVAGGVNRDDGLYKVRWERDGKIISYDIVKDFQSGNSLQSIGFKSGDQFCVTSKPKQLFWESFRDDVLPLLTFTLSSLTTAVSMYQAYRIYTDKK